MSKNWRIMPKISQEFVNTFPAFKTVFLQLLFNRGLSEEKAISDFLNQNPETNIHDSFLFRQMDEACDLIINHIKAGNKITVYGDYDADGVTSAGLLVEVLTVLKAKVEVYIPNRVEEGYGLNLKAIDEISAHNFKLIITVDSGIRNSEEVKYARQMGIDVVITDHHVPPEAEFLPDCIIVDPMVADETYPFKNLSGAGVSFKLAKSLINKSSLTIDDKIKLEKKVLDLVAIGTIADCVTVLGENRALIQLGMKEVNNTRRIGLRELINIASLNNHKVLDSWNISFQIAPRLNAAGRMHHANTAYELLITKDKEEAFDLAKKLNQNNIDRQKNTEEIMAEVEKQIKDINSESIIIATCNVAENKMEDVWNEGVIGLVAGKICEKYYRPTLVITKNKGMYKGSGRSIPEFNIIESISEASKYLDKYGGHPAACGFSLKSDKIDLFIGEMKKIAALKLGKLKLQPKINIDAEVELDELNAEFMEDLKKFEPYGINNEKPKFMSKNIIILDILKMGNDGQHIKLRVKDDNSRVFSAIGFSQTEKWQHLRIGDKIDIVYYVDTNEFNGRSEIQLKIIDIKTHNA